MTDSTENRRMVHAELERDTIDPMTLPELHLADWRPTKDTLHLYCQIVGKVRLATTPPRNHWWNAPLYVDVRGLTTRRLHHNEITFQIDFDFVDHPGGVLARSHLLRLLVRRRQRPRCRLLPLCKPEPDGLRNQPLPAGDWIESGAGSLAILTYEQVRTAPDPRRTLLAFVQAAYEAGARLAAWDTGKFESKWCPTPTQLHDLQVTAAHDFGRPDFAA